MGDPFWIRKPLWTGERGILIVVLGVFGVGFDVSASSRSFSIGCVDTATSSVIHEQTRQFSDNKELLPIKEN